MNSALSISVPDNSDLIIGQRFELTVTLALDTTAIGNIILSFNSATHINVPTNAITMLATSDGGNNQYSATIALKVSDQITENTPITFTIQATDTNNPQQVFSKKVQYLARSIDPKSLAFNVEHPFQTMPVADNKPPNGTRTKVYTTIKDLDGKALSGVPVFITNDTNGTFEKVNIYLDTNKDTQKIDTKMPSGNDGFTLLSDKDGGIIFYIYPIEGLSLILNLYAQIIGVTHQTVANDTYYVVNSDPFVVESPLQQPRILGFNRDNLISDGSPLFSVRINPYINPEIGDNILFFVNLNFTGIYKTLKNPKQLGSYFIKLPYSIFKENELSRFSYVVIRHHAGDMIPSNVLRLTYKGGVIYEPDPNVTRKYDASIVMTSAKTIIPADSMINYDYIRSYPPANITGLIVEISGNTGNNNTKVPLGAEVTLNIYIRSHNKNPPIQSMKDTMPKNGILQFNINYDDLVDIDSGDIKFDYSFTSKDSNDIGYGHVWAAEIDTVRVGIPIGNNEIDL
ncbi:hypothetical protein PSI15_09150 [Xenorhabdus sp. PR6a]|uniref:hypothetical protein n=1 Tax=Xenorhabdus sp. PR6a TaxID=3025877 RepID=UPI002359164D|nr:hypothetical protein [Xenorhabdus sp. PR6a]MDC9581729.1 hypothetical protein [Xenorhabdus sp. PR6a]